MTSLVRNVSTPTRTTFGESMDSDKMQFHEMGLDDRILKAVADLGWAQPTLIQEKAIPLALDGKDLLARARTGSGKTAAYAVPMIQQILTSKQTVREQAVRALVLVPTKELGQQVQAMIRQLTAYCVRDVRVADISGKTELSAQRPILMEKPDVVVGTPSRVQAHIKAQNLALNALEMLVIDEADLLFSFGFEADLKNLICHLPKIYQAFLMSATLNDDVQALKELVLHNPVTLKLQGSQLPDSSQLQQYSVKCEEEDKFLLIYTLLKLGLVRGKTLIFVGSLDRCYRLKLFLEQFSIPSCVLNSELPVHSRCHIISQFNQGFYDYIIATDEQGLDNPIADSQSGESKGKKKKKKNAKNKTGKDKEYGVSRGVDFQNIANVINFDFPTSVESYIHRVGRTARADNKGTALTFVSHSELLLLEEVECSLTEDSGNCALKPYGFKMDEIEGFRYRCRDAMRSVTKQAVKEARLKEIKQELLNSEKLKMYFEDNPRDLQLLRHDKDLHPAIIKPHLRNVPDYLIPSTMKSLVNPLLRRKKKIKPNPKGVMKTAFKKNIRGKNPLKSFRYAGKQKNKS
ncbi:probable ATP-dependent RNA helicase DDX56 isoform X2 [Silurus meridionalis]|uniref:probable ATP-dependent RNA helicase DDX56 isoform X2 n=1 Tax=Silurus meridionalis TaxID=175797 RepID=UPI001EECBD49|nr:probable ATP-dependent RNA helicase DDX56 isoform X2 [Silurus meridionalis]